MKYVAEEIERASLEEFHSVAPTAVRQSIGLESLIIGSAFVSIASALPSSAIVINRTIGVGLREPATEKAINEIVACKSQCNIGPQKRSDFLIVAE